MGNDLRTRINGFVQACQEKSPSSKANSQGLGSTIVDFSQQYQTRPERRINFERSKCMHNVFIEKRALNR